MITVIAEFEVKDGKTEEFVRLAVDCTRDTKKEAGNLSYKVYSKRDDDTKFTFVEEWANDVAIEKHNQMAHFKAFIDSIKPLLVREPEIKQIVKVAAIR